MHGLSLHGCVEQVEVALDGGRHRYLVSLPERGTALDVGEEEGDGAGGKIGHDPTQYEQRVVVRFDCRMDEDRTEAARSTRRCSASRW